MASIAYQYDFPPIAAYKNLNLNQANSVLSKFVVKETQNVPIRIKKNENQLNISLTKTYKLNNIYTAANETPFHHSDISDKKLFTTSKDFKSRSSAHGSTLRLHIAAYEDSNESVDLEWMDNESKLKKERKLLFEIPRHPSKEKSGVPEIMNFKANQKLLNPNKVASPATDSVLQPVSSVTPKIFTPVQKKRPANTVPESADEKKSNNASSSFATTKIVTESRNASRSSLIGFDPDKFFITPPLASPTSSRMFSSPPEQKRINKLEEQLKETQKKLQKEEMKKEEQKEKYTEYYHKCRNLKVKCDKMEQKRDEDQRKFQAEKEDLTAQLNEANNDFLQLLEKQKSEKDDADKTITELENEILILKDSLQQQQQLPQSKKTFDIKVNGKFLPQAKLTMAKLTNLGVGINTVGPVMECAAEMLGYTLNAIPSARTVGKSPFLSQYLIQEQLRRVIVDARTKGIAATSCSDETKKNGFVWQNYLLRIIDEENQARSYCLGNVPVTDKSSETSIHAMEGILQALNNEDGINYWETFIMGLGNRMSDEAGTEKLFTKRVEGLRKVIMDGKAEYDHLSDQQKENLSKLEEFYCQLHVLQNVTIVASNVLLEDEKELRKNDSISEPAVIKLLKYCSKHLGNRAASKYTSNMPWKDYCKNNNIDFGRIPDFVGNRFNIVFAIASCVFFLREHIIAFIEKFDTDLRQTPILQWLNDPIVVGHLLILSSFNLWITAPLLRLTEKSTSITTLTTYAEKLIAYLEEVKQNPLTLLTGRVPFEDFEEAEEVTPRSLAHVQHLDTASRSLQNPERLFDVTEDLADETSIYFKKKYKDFLPGGQHYATSADIQTVPLHNKGCEHNFGLLTWDYHKAPFKRTAVRAIGIQAHTNRTYNWYDKLSDEEKEKLLKEAIINAPKLEKDAAAQQKAFDDARWSRVIEQQRQDEIANAIKARKIAESNMLVNKYGGCWTTVDQMAAFLNQEQRVSEKRKALEAQLKFHKLSATTDKSDTKLCILSMLNEQGKRVPKPLDILTRNLEIIIIKKNVYEEEDEDE